ncbi:nicotinate (nicotinamide) nucleotide adenylyltransferase [Rubritalea spongiae]|uniref:Probable nicotinate-nucleotide adenylyltransferase n=1 Tax=Rubritalea spongiae TaxID=430797 RepID=A0ABW5E848_9BACT
MPSHRSTMETPQTKICLIGGTFDPIHLGHTYIALQAKLSLSLDKVIFLPCRQSPHKLDIETASDAHRLKMCKLATAELPWAEVSDYDLTAPTLSYSWRTAEHFKALYPDAELFWLMGTDQWNALPRWNRAEHFAQLLQIIVFHRTEPLLSLDGFQSLPLSGQHPASATAVRNDAQKNRPMRWLHPKVANYIKENKLYTK